jgi:hypothetical protein
MRSDEDEDDERNGVIATDSTNKNLFVDVVVLHHLLHHSIYDSLLCACNRPLANRFIVMH